MRVYELFENDELTEIRMDPSSLASATENIDATVGIEFEMVVPGDDTFDDDPDLEPDYEYDEVTNNIDTIVNFFDDGDYNSSRMIRRLDAELRGDFADWATEDFNSRWEVDGEEFVYRYIRDNVDVEDIAAGVLGLDPEEIDGLTKKQMAEAAGMIFGDKMDPWYTEAFDSAQQDHLSDEDLQSDWLESEGLDTMRDIQHRYDITWPYWEPANSNDTGIDIDDIADSFSRFMKKPVNVSKKYHGGRREAGHYVVEPDGSINAPDGYIGLEFVSPPMPLNEMIKEIKKVREWAESVGAITNKSTGLHMNVSVAGLDDKNLDYVKLALLLGDQYVLKQFGREANNFTVGAISKIQDRVKSLSSEQLENYLEQVKNGLNRRASDLLGISGFGKYTSINPKTGYIEFRSPGGDYLNENPDKLINTLRRFVVATQAAMDPDAYRQEYVSKLTRLLTPSAKPESDTIRYFARYAAGELPKQALKSFLRQAQLQRKAGKGPEGPQYWWNVQWDSNREMEVVAPDKKSAREVAAREWGVPVEQLAIARVTVIKPYDENTQTAQTTTSSTPLPELNGRPSNPDGNAYIATTQDPNTPLYRFMAANGDDARTVLDQWERTHGGNYVWRPDPQQERGQPAIPGSTIDLARRRAAAAQSPSLNLTAPTWYPDANYAIVRNSDQAVIEYFIRNTPAEAQAAYTRWLNNMGAGSSFYTLIPLTPRPSSAEQTNQDIVGWRVLLSTGEEVHRGNNPGIDQQEATQRAAAWLRNNGYGVAGEGFRVEPIYRGEEDTPHEFDGDRNTQWRILVGGEEVHRFWNRAIQSDANDAARTWILDQIRRGLLSPAQGAEIEVVPVTANSIVLPFN